LLFIDMQLILLACIAVMCRMMTMIRQRSGAAAAAVAILTTFSALFPLISYSDARKHQTAHTAQTPLRAIAHAR